LVFKICPKCGEKCPARIRKCKGCDSVFAFKVKKKGPRSSRVDDWRVLVSGDEVNYPTPKGIGLQVS
jgi:ribosomal protein L40E